MSETAVRVDLREATLTESARLSERGERLFLAMENPPPVRSLLRVFVEGERKAFEVARVIEVVEEGEAARGCYGGWVDVARLTEQDKVGSEHLEPGISSGNAGVPAPVVMMSTSEMMLNDPSEDDDLVLTRSERFAASDEGASEASEAEVPPAADQPTSETASSEAEAGAAEPEPEHD